MKQASPGAQSPRHETSPRHTRPMQQRSLLLVDRVLAAAADIAREKGLAAVTTNAVAKRARVSVTAVYRYFPDRLAILYALMAREVEIYAAVLQELFVGAPPSSLGELIHLAVEGRASMYRTKGSVSSLLLVELVGEPDAALNRSRLVAAVLVDTLYETFDMPSNQNQAKRVELGVRVGDILIHRAFKLDPAGDTFILGEAESILLSYLTSIYSDDEVLRRHQKDEHERQSGDRTRGDGGAQ
jgi:AcrR family transcriptional regulator